MSVNSKKPLSADEVSDRHQAYLDKTGLRTAQGSFYTPFAMVERIYDIALKDLKMLDKISLGVPFRLLDPTCGTGNFLVVGSLLLAEVYVRLGHPETEALTWVIENCIYGSDIDALAVEQCIQSLVQLSRTDLDVRRIQNHFHIGNALLLQAEADSGDALFSMVEETWATVFPEVFGSANAGFDAVFGNPPFLNQLNTETALSEEVLMRVRQSLGPGAQSLTNAASLFLRISKDVVKSDVGLVAMVQPMSILATRDSLEIRTKIDQEQALQAVWVCEDQVFDAAVQTCVLFIGNAALDVPIYAGAAGKFVKTLAVSEELGNWSRYLHASKGYSSISLEQGRNLGEITTSFNDFRDEYYGLVGKIVDTQDADSRDHPKLLTVGKIDFATQNWGQSPTKFAKNSFDYPRVELQRLEPKLQKWAAERTVPKVLVATQTKVIELFVDDSGEFLPSIPIASVLPNTPHDLWRVAACLAAPPVSMYAFERLAGAGMSSDVLKVSARFISTIPLPTNGELWDEGAELIRAIHSLDSLDPRREETVKRFGLVMCDAFNVGDLSEIIMNWWLGRI